jgi:hypothetical protein
MCIQNNGITPAASEHYLRHPSLTNSALLIAHGEHFQQDISAKENRYKGDWSAAMLDNYCWMVKRDALEIHYTRQRKRHLV